VIDDFSYTTLDRNEYNRHKERMDYPKDLKKILEQELYTLKCMIESREVPFSHQTVMDYYHEFQKDHPYE
jgi:protein associated with RNAse G/E